MLLQGFYKMMMRKRAWHFSSPCFICQGVCTAYTYRYCTRSRNCLYFQRSRQNSTIYGNIGELRTKGHTHLEFATDLGLSIVECLPMLVICFYVSCVETTTTMLCSWDELDPRGVPPPADLDPVFASSA